jgi:hypothetical protein
MNQFDMQVFANELLGFADLRSFWRVNTSGHEQERTRYDDSNSRP